MHPLDAELVEENPAELRARFEDVSARIAARLNLPADRVEAELPRMLAAQEVCEDADILVWLSLLSALTDWRQAGALPRLEPASGRAASSPEPP